MSAKQFRYFFSAHHMLFLFFPLRLKISFALLMVFLLKKKKKDGKEGVKTGFAFLYSFRQKHLRSILEG